jgi:shikimate kinase
VPRVLLVGLMATGKSSVGRALAAATGWPELDNDVVLERSTGCTAAQLLARSGLGALRTAESHVLTVTLAVPPPLVASVAAGAVLDERDRERLRNGGHVVWLRAPAAVLVRRLQGAQHRPFLEDDPLETLTAMAAERDPLFAEVAHQVLDVDVLTPAAAAREVMRALEPR